MDRVTELLLAGLKQALASSDAQRLYKSGKLDGLFPGRTGAAGDAAGRALREGLLEVIRTESKGKTAIDWVRPTPAGVELVHSLESPARALDELRTALRLNQQAIPAWLDALRASLGAMEERLSAEARAWNDRFEALSRRVDETLRRIEQSVPALPADLLAAHPWAIDAINYLDRRKSGGATDDCPLSELFAALRRSHPGLSLAAFHEGLRRLHGRHVLRLCPCAGNAVLPEPEYALLDGDAVLYYVRR